jgi:hypothetical protein
MSSNSLQDDWISYEELEEHVNSQLKIDEQPKDETSYKLQEKKKLVLKNISLQIKN